MSGRLQTKHQCDRIEQLEALNTDLLTALKRSVIAIDDWLNTYASDHCDESRVLEAKKRIKEVGGTIGYISDIQEANRTIIAKVEEK